MESKKILEYSLKNTIFIESLLLGKIGYQTIQYGIQYYKDFTTTIYKSMGIPSYIILELILCPVVLSITYYKKQHNDKHNSKNSKENIVNLIKNIKEDN